MRILIATDFSKHADRAIACVSSMDLPSGSHVRLIYAIEPVTTVGVFAPSDLLMLNDTERDEARAMVRAAAKRIERPQVKVDGMVGYGRAADVVCDEARAFEPDLLVVGSRGRGAIATNVLGSVSAELVDRSPCPVLVARTTSLGRIVFAEDGSPDAGAAATVIARFAPFRAAAVDVVSVVNVPFPLVFAEPSGATAAEVAYREYQASLPIVRDRCDYLARDRSAWLRSSGITSTWQRREGDPAYELIAAAETSKADCIVIGSRGQTGVRRLVLGSVARSVLFHAPCSVLVTHASHAASKSSAANGQLALVTASGKEVTR